MKRIEITKPLWHFGPPYYQALLVIEEGDPISLLGGYPARTTPNIQRPGQADRPNLEEYPVLAGGIYEGKIIYGGYHGKTGILISGGDGVPAFQHKNPRYPQQGKMITGVWIHEGQKNAWPGSAGCITVAPGGAAFLEEHFSDGEDTLITVPGPEPGFLLEDAGDYGRR